MTRSLDPPLPDPSVDKLFVIEPSALLRTVVIGVLAYVVLLVFLRVSGKRTLSKMNAFDFVVTVALGSTLAAVFTQPDVSLTQGVVALSLLVALQFVNTFLAVRWPGYQRLLKAQPTLVFFRGKPLDDAMRRQRLTLDEVLEAIRQQGHAQPGEIDAVVLETEGSLSVLKSDAASAEALERLGVDVRVGVANTGRSQDPSPCPYCGRSA
jgi:uncharacterized membrane protein YcaP (DUF421 family)